MFPLTKMPMVYITKKDKNAQTVRSRGKKGSVAGKGTVYSPMVKVKTREKSDSAMLAQAKLKQTEKWLDEAEKSRFLPKKKIDPMKYAKMKQEVQNARKKRKDLKRHLKSLELKKDLARQERQDLLTQLDLLNLTLNEERDEKYHMERVLEAQRQQRHEMETLLLEEKRQRAELEEYVKRNLKGKDMAVVEKLKQRQCDETGEEQGLRKIEDETTTEKFNAEQFNKMKLHCQNMEEELDIFYEREMDLRRQLELANDEIEEERSLRQSFEDQLVQFTQLLEPLNCVKRELKELNVKQDAVCSHNQELEESKEIMQEEINRLNLELELLRNEPSKVHNTTPVFEPTDDDEQVEEFDVQCKERKDHLGRFNDSRVEISTLLDEMTESLKGKQAEEVNLKQECELKANELARLKDDEMKMRMHIFDHQIAHTISDPELSHANTGKKKKKKKPSLLEKFKANKKHLKKDKYCAENGGVTLVSMRPIGSNERVNTSRDASKHKAKTVDLKSDGKFLQDSTRKEKRTAK